jgi:hypothetical protein
LYLGIVVLCCSVRIIELILSHQLELHLNQAIFPRSYLTLSPRSHVISSRYPSNTGRTLTSPLFVLSGAIVTTKRLQAVQASFICFFYLFVCAVNVAKHRLCAVLARFAVRNVEHFAYSGVWPRNSCSNKVCIFAGIEYRPRRVHEVRSDQATTRDWTQGFEERHTALKSRCVRMDWKLV